MQRRKSLTISIFSLLLAACLALGLFFTLYKSDVASAARGEAFTVIGDVDNDLYKGGSKPFNSELLTQLFEALTGKSDFDDVKNLLQSDSDHALTSEDFRTVQGNANTGNNVSVWLGGKKWDAVHMTTVRANYSGLVDGDSGAPENAGDIVLTLWQSADNVPEEKNKFTTHASTGDPYPASMYTPSYTRVVVLNAGGSYSTTGTDVVSYTQKTSENENTYARFTSPSAKDSLTPYIVKPKDIEYQETESGSLTANSVCGSYYLPNDAYGTPAAGTCGLGDYATKGSGETAYNYWRNDYLWLPSFAETGLSDYANSNGVWLTNVPLRSAMPGTGNWVRSSAYDIRNRPLYLSDGGSNTYCGSTDEHHVRPAIHINISKIAEEAGALAPAKPAEEDLNKSLEYTGEAQQWTLPELKDATYTAQGDDTAFWNSDTKTITATNAGEYKVEVTPPSEGWKDGSKDPVTFTLTITHAKINVTFPDNSSDKRNFGHKIEYIYHDDGTTHALKFPDTEDDAATRKIISLTAGATDDDKQNLHIYYIIKTHNEDACPGDAINTANKPTENDGDWKEYTKGDNELNVAANVLKGYCVYYKITAPNHETLIDWFSVHIMKEELTITAAVTIPSVTYGSAPHKQDALKALVLPQITQIADQKGEIRYSNGGADNKLNGDKFLFYFTRNVDGRLNEYRTTDDEGSPDRWPAGEYTLAVKYTDNTDDNNYISFKWANGAPKFTIDPMEVSLKWTGNEDWGDDGADVIALASDGEKAKMTDEFNWVYDNNTHAPKATFKDADGKDIDVTVTVGSGNPKDANSNAYEAEATIADKNYTIKKGDEKKEFYIRKAANRWISEYWREGWSIGGDPSEEHNANALWGTPKKEYFTNPERTDKFQGDFNNIVQDTTIYVKITVTATPNYDGLESDDSDKYQFSIVTCDHPDIASAQYEADNNGKHFRRCPDCKQKLDIAEHVADENERERGIT